MAAKKYTFIEIFNEDFYVNESDTIKISSIVIPIIQRDYAQGRRSNNVSRVRNRFIEALLSAVEGDGITLDFVYGDIDFNGVLTPLDGQQRLTTLFLLHWYAAKQNGITPVEYDFLRKFTYETRYSSRDFCSALIDFEPSFDGNSISQEIIDESWFPLSWQNDPTIDSMLVMLDEIHNAFRDVDCLWDRLEDGAISFYFLPIKNMGLTDEIYIKMNSRGKLLTSFEHFKAELEHELSKYDEGKAKSITEKIDLAWTDYLWEYRDESNVIDDAFLNYFSFICDIICYKSGHSPNGRLMNPFDLLYDYFSANDDLDENIAILESFFDCWGVAIEKYGSISSFWNKFVATQYTPGKTKLSNSNLFRLCVNDYLDNNGKRKYSLGNIIILYAVVVYLQNYEDISEYEFSRRLRVIKNLTHNSPDDISDRETRSSGNRMPQVLEQVESIILNGVIDSSIERTFNTYQIEEENLKLEWTEHNKESEELLYKLEDHDLLEGQIAILGLDNIDKVDEFYRLFKYDNDTICRALMSCEDYGQLEQNRWRYQYGSPHTNEAWKTLFHKSSNSYFNNTSNALRKLISGADCISESFLHTVINDFLSDRVSAAYFDFRYYYVKYEAFRDSKYGKYTWTDRNTNQYSLLIMQTKQQLSENSYQPFLYIVDPDSISREHLGEYIIRNKIRLCVRKDAFVFLNDKHGTELDRIPIEQDDNGIDKEDRVEKLSRLYLSMIQ